MPPFFDRLDTPIIAKSVKRRFTITVYKLSHNTFQSLFAKLMHTIIVHQHRDLHPNDSLHEYDLPISAALEPTLLKS